VTAAARITPVYQGLSRTIEVPSCVLSIDDLRKLFADLDALTREAIGKQIDGFVQPVGMSASDFANSKSQVKKESGLTMYVFGKHGEQIAITSPAAITRDALPDRLSTVTFDSAASFKIQVNYDPMNRFRLVFDFTESPLLGNHDPWNQPTPNQSLFEIVGADQTWVAGVADKVLGFLRARKRARRWLHGAGTFTLLGWVVGIPAILWLIYRWDGLIQRVTGVLPSALRAVVYIYIFLLLFLFYRGLFYFVRWLFPIIELEGSRSKAARAIGGAIVLGLVTGLVYDVLKAMVQ
jgi:hypothetical protein